MRPPWIFPQGKQLPLHSHGSAVPAGILLLLPHSRFDLQPGCRVCNFHRFFFFLSQSFHDQRRSNVEMVVPVGVDPYSSGAGPRQLLC